MIITWGKKKKKEKKKEKQQTFFKLQTAEHEKSKNPSMYQGALLRSSFAVRKSSGSVQPVLNIEPFKAFLGKEKKKGGIGGAENNPKK